MINGSLSYFYLMVLVFYGFACKGKQKFVTSKNLTQFFANSIKRPLILPPDDGLSTLKLDG